MKARRLSLSSQNSPRRHYDGVRGTVVCDVPVEMLFTEGNEHLPVENPTSEWRAHRGRYADLALARDTAHLSLYRHLLAGGDPTLYLRWYEGLSTTRGFTPEASGAALLVQRAEHLKVFQEAAARSPDVLWATAPTAQWNHKRQCFNLRDGHHRAAALFVSGRRSFPVEMSIEDHEHWMHRPAAMQVHEEFLRQQRSRIYSPILHPLFSKVPAHRDTTGPTRLDLVLGFFGSHRLDGKSLLDVGANTCFYSQHFAREGLRVTAVEYDEKHVALGRLLNTLFRLDITVRQEPFSDNDLAPHDIGVVLTVLYHQFRESEATGQAFLKAMDSKIKELVIWESGEAPETEIELVRRHTRFSRYHELGTTYGTGRKRALGIFTTEAFASAHPHLFTQQHD